MTAVFGSITVAMLSVRPVSAVVFWSACLAIISKSVTDIHKPCCARTRAASDPAV